MFSKSRHHDALALKTRAERPRVSAAPVVPTCYAIAILMVIYYYLYYDHYKCYSYYSDHHDYYGDYTQGMGRG